MLLDISIHAPVKSATLIIKKLLLIIKNFNPRARKERDGGGIGCFASAADFNPRARKERDIS